RPCELAWIKSSLPRQPCPTAPSPGLSDFAEASVMTTSVSSFRGPKERITHDPGGREHSALRRGQPFRAPRSGARLVGRATEWVRSDRVVLARPDRVHSNWDQPAPAPAPTDA